MSVPPLIKLLSYRSGRFNSLLTWGEFNILRTVPSDFSAIRPKAPGFTYFITAPGLML